MSDKTTDPVGGLTVEAARDILKEAVGDVRAEMRDEVIALVKEERQKALDAGLGKEGAQAAAEAVASYTKHAMGTAGADAARVDVQAFHKGVMQAKSIAPMALAFMTRAIAGAGGAKENMKSWLEEKVDAIEKSGAVKASHVDRVVKGISGLTFGSGGALIPEDMAAELIEALRASSIMRQMGTRTIDMPSGNLRIGRVKVPADPQAVQEGTGPNAGTYTFEDVVLVAKKLMTIVPITKDLLEQSNQTVDAFVAEDMQEAMRVKEDLQLLRGSGTGNEHLGLFNIMKTYYPANALPSSGITVAQVIGDLRDMMTAPRTLKVPERDPGWLGNHRSRNFLFTLLDTNSNHVFRDEITGGMLYGYKMGITENIPQNLGGGNESEFAFTDFGHLVIGDTRQLRVEVVDGAAYKNEAGNVVSAFTDDEVVAKTSLKSGFNSRHLGRETVLLEAVTWGA
jgi:HK97 family phage major capsid protein